MNPLVQQQTDNNASSAGGWETYTAHRKIVTRLLMEMCSPAGGRLCVLGAGNCNDLELPALLQVFREIHLVDLDGDALARGVARQGLENHTGVIQHGGCDVTGMLEQQGGWSRDTTLGEDDLTECRDAPARLTSSLAAPFDVVASTSLLSQILLAVAQSLGERHPRYLDVLQAIRWGHLRLLLDLLAPGGLGLLITDLVSSDTAPELRRVSDSALPGYLNQLVEARNFFHGVNPAVLHSLLATDRLLRPQVTDLAAIPPWRWDLRSRVYAVCAFRFRKQLTASSIRETHP